MNDDMQSCEIGIDENEDNTQLILPCVCRVLLDMNRCDIPLTHGSGLISHNGLMIMCIDKYNDNPNMDVALDP